MSSQGLLKIAPLLLLSACTTAGRYESVDGAQGGVRAKVMEVLSQEQAATLTLPCAPSAAPEGEHLQWLITEFRRDRMRSSVLAVAHDGQHVSLNSAVEIKPQFCADGKIYQVVRVLKTLPVQ